MKDQLNGRYLNIRYQYTTINGEEKEATFLIPIVGPVTQMPLSEENFCGVNLNALREQILGPKKDTTNDRT